MILTHLQLLFLTAGGSQASTNRVTPAFGAQIPYRRHILQYQAVVGPFTAAQPQAAPERPGGMLGGSIAYRPTLTQYQSLAGPMGVFAPPSIRLGWTTVLGQYFHTRPRQQVSWAAPLRVADVTTAVPVGSWKGTAPDRLSRPETARTGLAAISWSAAIPFQDPTRFAWRSVAPDWVASRGILPASQRFLALETPVQYPIPETSWGPILPAWLRAARPLTVRTAYTLYAEPLPNAPSPDLAWAGWQPSRLARTRRVVEFSPYTQPPKLTPFVPDLVGGLASYPDWLTRRGLLPAAQRVWTDRFDIVIPDLRRDWSPIYPDLLHRPPTRGGVDGRSTWNPGGNPAALPTDWRKVGPNQVLARLRLAAVDAGSVPLPPSLDVFTGELMAWEPDRVYFPSRRIVITDATRVGNLNPTVPGGGIPCIEIIQFAATRSCLTLTAATTSGLVDLSATVTQGTDLDWC